MIRQALLLLALLLAHAPQTQAPWVIKFQPGADTSEALVCARSGPADLTCGDLAGFMHTVDVARAAAAERARRQDALEDTWRNVVEL